MTYPKKRPVRLPGFDLECDLFDQLEKIRLERGLTWRAALSEGVALLVKNHGEAKLTNGGIEEV